jgi:hypothetical protein
VLVPIRDGIRLPTELYRPPHDRDPAIVLRKPYGRSTIYDAALHEVRADPSKESHARLCFSQACFSHARTRTHARESISARAKLTWAEALPLKPTAVSGARLPPTPKTPGALTRGHVRTREESGSRAW